MPKILVAIPTKLMIHAHTLESIQKCFNIPNYTLEMKYLVGKSNIDQARSMMITTWYDEDHDDDDLFFFVDSDQIFDESDLKALIGLNSDVACGLYQGHQALACGVVNYKALLTGEDNNLLYAATGLMLIRRPILRRIEAFIRDEQMGQSRLFVSPDYPSVIPFFFQRRIPSERMYNNGIPIQEWLSEDYAFCYLVRKCGGSLKGHLSPSIGHEIPHIKYFYPPEYKKRIWGNKSIAYYMGKSGVLWNPNEMNTTGLGGSETAVVYLTKYWKEMGYNITVYGNVIEGTYEGVEYFEASKLNLNDEFNIVILWRAYGLDILKYVNAKRVIIDLHDELTPNHNPILENHQKIDYIMVKSEYHKSLFNGMLGNKIRVIQNSIPDYYFTTKNVDEIPKRRYKLIYSAFYTRGLHYMLQWGWPIIKSEVPEAELHIFYGTDTIDPKFVKMIQPLLKQDGVYEHGKIGQRELYRQKLDSSIYYYMGGYGETDCINVKEAIYANCLPVVCNVTALRDKKFCLKIEGEPTDQTVQMNGAQIIVKLLKDPEAYKSIMDELKKHKEDIESWKDVAKKWLDTVFVF